MKRNCILRMRGTKVEVNGIIDGNNVFLPTGKIADCKYWEIIEPKHCFWCLALSAVAFIGAVFLGFIFWGEQ